MIKTLFFDFGNVIAYFDHWRAVNKLTAFTDMSGRELFAMLYDGPLEDEFEHGHLTTAQYVSEGIRRGRLTCTPEQFMACFLDIFTPNEEVIAAIPRLAKTYRICLASNTNDAHFRHYCQQFADTLKHFSALPTSHQAGHRKPSSGFYEYCQRFAQAEPGECLFIDDVEKNIVGGQRHGWQTLHYRSGEKMIEKLLG